MPPRSGPWRAAVNAPNAVGPAGGILIRQTITGPRRRARKLEVTLRSRSGLAETGGNDLNNSRNAGGRAHRSPSRALVQRVAANVVRLRRARGWNQIQLTGPAAGTLS